MHPHCHDMNDNPSALGKYHNPICRVVPGVCFYTQPLRGPRPPARFVHSELVAGVGSQANLHPGPICRWQGRPGRIHTSSDALSKPKRKVRPATPGELQIQNKLGNWDLKPRIWRKIGPAVMARRHGAGYATRGTHRARNLATSGKSTSSNVEVVCAEGESFTRSAQTSRIVVHLCSQTQWFLASLSPKGWLCR